jgi:hypothetical protein
MMTLGLLLAAIPFGFAVLRAVGTGTDLRYLWVALAAAVAAWAVLRFGGRGVPPTGSGVAVAFVASMAAASVAGFVQGAQSVPAVLFVALGFAICEAGGLALVHGARAG